MKKVPILILVLLVIGGLYWFFNSNGKSNPNELTLYGNIEIRQVDLSFQSGGQIAQLLKEEGDSIKAGELLAVIDAKDYEANLTKANADIEVAIAKLQDANDKYERNAPLGVDDTVSKQDVESLYNNKNMANAEYNAAVANRDYIQNQLDYTKLYAPDDGIIMIRVQEPGATVSKGQTIYTVAKTRPLWVRAYVNEPDLGNIKYGQKVRVYTDSVNPKTDKKREYEGQIGFISSVAEFTPKTVQSTDTRPLLVYRIHVYINDVDEYIKQGMPVTINVDLGGDDSSKKEQESK
ncbi:MAG: efflux RND transporter periplasmic adaptor subunit [Phascolarctobacterium sp.]|nr:efflux RND transporter periplasmic adaptor subunit [Phascolarctobacterium sp.]